MGDERWVDTHSMCNGFASYNGPCGDPYCANCYPGGEVCTDCKELKGCCECDNCSECGEAWMEEYGKQHDECPHCYKYCLWCGEAQSEHDEDECPNEEFEAEELETDAEFDKRREKIRKAFREEKNRQSD